LSRQRGFDIVASLLLLPAFVAVGVVVAVAVLIDSPGPVFYRSRRIGRHGRPFRMLKFRKMRHGDFPGVPLTTRDDERLTPVGRFLARSRLDELPQIWNVLKGDMRLVGPRPEVEEFVEAHPREFARIHEVPPGLTGVAQLRFFDESHRLPLGEERAAVYLNQVLPLKLALDLTYLERQSVWGDVAILARTVLLPLQVALRWARERKARPARRHGGLVLLGSALLVSFVAQSGPV
jgi:lipopolysaccharide/colanic/teichoic acid biosynthesis glycosyltransferase